MTTYNDSVSYSGVVVSLPVNAIATAYNGPTSRTPYREGGQDTVPQVFTYASATTVWNAPDYKEQGYYLQRAVPSVSFPVFQVNGNSTGYQQHLTSFGAVFGRVTRANLGMTRAPAYVDVVADGVQYKLQINPSVSATVPGNVVTIIGMSGDYTWTNG